MRLENLDVYGMPTDVWLCLPVWMLVQDLCIGVCTCTTARDHILFMLALLSAKYMYMCKGVTVSYVHLLGA